MKKIKLMAVASLMTVAGVASAHTQGGAVGSTTLKTARSDIFTVNCFDDGSGAGVPTKIYFHVKGTPANTKITNLPRITITASKGGTSATSTVAKNNGSYSPGLFLSKGAGSYTITVTKPASTVLGVVNYTAEYHCESASGSHAGTGDPYFTQNQ